MAFAVSRVAAQPKFDSLPVAKIIHYPLEPRDYRPFAQNQICVGPDKLYLQMWAFEVSPPRQSSQRCVLYLFAQQPELALSVEVAPALQARWAVGLMEKGVDRPLTTQQREQIVGGMQLHPHNGEDLQGVYWGYTLALDRQMLEGLGGPLSLEVGDRFLGNFYKLCPTPPFAHYGCFYPADFTQNPYTPPNMGEFKVVGY